jgi:tRNA dimethylallyltransferase
MAEEEINLVTVLGHTAGGKTVFAAHLADRINGEIISADSRQVYRGMDIGTGKDYDDYVVDGRRIPVHLTDIMDAGYEYNVYLFKQDFLRVYTDVKERGKMPILCGGTGLYIEAVLKNYRLLHVPVNQELRDDLGKKSYEELTGILKLYGPLHNVTDTVNRKRLIRAIEIAMYQGSAASDSEDEYKLIPLVLGIRFDRMTRRKRITERLQYRLKHGLVEEVEELIRNGVPTERMDYYGLEYRYVTQYLLHLVTYEEMVEKLNHAIHQFAKRQMTYFRGMEHRGISILWLEGTMDMEEKLDMAMSLYASGAGSGEFTT